MVRFVDALMRADVTSDEWSVCGASNTSVRTLRRWKRKAGFAEWLRQEAMRRLADDVWAIWSVVAAQARGGDMQAAKLYLSRFDPEGERLSPTVPLDFRALAEMAQHPDTTKRTPPG